MGFAAVPMMIGKRTLIPGEEPSGPGCEDLGRCLGAEHVRVGLLAPAVLPIPRAPRLVASTLSFEPFGGE